MWPADPGLEPQGWELAQPSFSGLGYVSPLFLEIEELPGGRGQER